MSSRHLVNIDFFYLSISTITSLGQNLRKEITEKKYANIFYRISKLITFQKSYRDKSNVCECPSHHMFANTEQKDPVSCSIVLFSPL